MRVKEPSTLMLPQQVTTNIDKYIEASYSSNTDREYICYIVDHLHYQESITRKKNEKYTLLVKRARYNTFRDKITRHT